jgi:hypothetical protein
VKLIITNAIDKAEFEPLKKTFNLEIIKNAARKSLQGLGNDIKSSFKIPATSLNKIYLTGPGSAGRAMFLLKIGEAKSVLVMIRTKKDKQIGLNMTIKNPKFKKALNKNLGLIIADLEQGNYREYEIV